MDVRILDLDGSVAEQPRLRRRASRVLSLRDWGPQLRLACSWRSFARFEQELARLDGDAGPNLTFVGSGDFHHVSLALLRRLRQPCNLLVIDNHPDWMRGAPFLHCGTWVYHAARLPHVRNVYHAGGDVDFDNHYRWLAPWSMLRSGKITVFPAVRRFQSRAWKQIPQHVLRDEAIAPDMPDLPLYISLDRDVLRADEATVNWDSGHLGAQEVLSMIETFLRSSDGLAGMDVVGDWSPVHVQGPLRRFLHWTEHPVMNVHPEEAQARNEQLNLNLVELLAELAPPRKLETIT